MQSCILTDSMFHPEFRFRFADDFLNGYIGEACLSLYYYMFGDQLGSLWIYLLDPDDSRVVFQVFGDQGEQWNYREISLMVNSSQSVVSTDILSCWINN